MKIYKIYKKTDQNSDENTDTAEFCYCFCKNDMSPLDRVVPREFCYFSNPTLRCSQHTTNPFSLLQVFLKIFPPDISANISQIFLKIFLQIFLQINTLVLSTYHKPLFTPSNREQFILQRKIAKLISPGETPKKAWKLL